MRIIIFILFYGIEISGFCQGFEVVDRKAIEKAIKAEDSKTYYPRLLQRFEQFDRSLTAEDYRLLYYGFVFDDEYTGYNDNRSQEIQEMMKNKDYVGAIKTCDSVLKKIPISLTINYLKGLCIFYQDADDSIWLKYRDRYDYLVEAILSSGNGLECNTAFKTIFVSDEYEIIYKIFEVDEFKGQSLVGQCDLLRIKPTEKFNHEEIYFDTSETLNAFEKAFKKNK